MNGTIYKFERDMLRGESIHVQKKRDHTWFKKHWHNYFEIIYYKNCVGECKLNGESYPVRGECLFLLTPKDFHEILTEEVAGSHSVILSFVEQAVDGHVLDALTAGPVVCYDLPPLLCAQIEEMAEVFRGKSDYRKQHLTHLLNCVLIAVLERGKPAGTAVRDVSPMVRESIAYMLTNPAERITLQTFAQRFGVTPAYFSRLFHGSTGIAFKQYLTDLRIECAKRMLEERELPIIDVGFECGFQTPSQFVRSFKARVGQTPSVYRARKT